MIITIYPPKKKETKPFHLIILSMFNIQNIFFFVFHFNNNITLSLFYFEHYYIIYRLSIRLLQFLRDNSYIIYLT